MQRSSWRVLTVLLLLLTAVQLRAQLRPPPSDTGMKVDSVSITVHFPLPYLTVRVPDPAIVGHFAWRIAVDGDSAFAVVLTADTAMRTNNLNDVIRASTLRSCSVAVTSVLDCRNPIKGSVDVGAFSIKVRITDPRVVAAVLRSRPEDFWHYVYEPGARFRVEKLPFEYTLEVRNHPPAKTAK